MVKRRQKKWLWLLLPVLLTGTFGFVVWQQGSANHLISELTAPTCSDPVLTTAPTKDDANVTSITPLGNISLPQHALPTEHTYHVLKRGIDGLPLNTEVFSPANLRVTGITHISSTRNGQQRDNDYKVDMLPCRQVRIQFDHIRELAPKLAAAYTASKPRCQEYQRAGDQNKYCTVSMNVKLSAGELIGQAGGGLPAAFDFGATDGRVKPLEFANNKRYRADTRRTVCPYDLYGKEIKDRFSRLLGDDAQRRTVEPVCGSVAQDVSGTAQGNWYQGKGSSDQLEQQQKTLSLIHDNVDAALGLLVIGHSKIKVVFSPIHSGSVNREFAEVVPGQEVYCYQPDGLSSRAGYGSQAVFRGSVLVRLASATELDVEQRAEACSSTTFTNPTRYIR